VSNNSTKSTHLTKSQKPLTISTIINLSSMKNKLGLATAALIAAQTAGCEPDGPNFPYTPGSSDSCEVSITPDGDRILWEMDGTATELRAELSYLEGGLKDILTLPTDPGAGTITALPKYTQGLANLGIDPTIDIHIQGINENGSTICEDSASMDLPSIELPETLAAVHGDIQTLADTNLLTNETVQALNGKVAIRVLNGTNPLENPVPSLIVLEDLLMPLFIRGIFEIDESTGYAIAIGSDLQNGNIYTASEQFPGLTETGTRAINVEEGTSELVTNTTDVRTSGMHHKLFMGPQESADELTIHSMGWAELTEEEFDAGLSEVALIQTTTVDANTLEITDVHTSFDPRDIFKDQEERPTYGNSAEKGPKGPSGKQWETYTYPDTNRLGERALVVAIPVGENSPTMLFTKDTTTLADNYQEHYPDVQVITIPETLPDNSASMIFLHSTKLWEKDNGELGHAQYNLMARNGHNSLDIFEIDPNTGTATWVCGHEAAQAGHYRGNLTLPTYDSKLMGYLTANPVNNETGEAEYCKGSSHWINVDTCELVVSSETTFDGSCEDHDITHDWLTTGSTSDLQNKTDVLDRTTEYNLDILEELGMLLAM
jgi:hypothetical protein